MNHFQFKSVLFRICLKNLCFEIDVFWQTKRISASDDIISYSPLIRNSEGEAVLPLVSMTLPNEFTQEFFDQKEQNIAEKAAFIYYKDKSLFPSSDKVHNVSSLEWL